MNAEGAATVQFKNSEWRHPDARPISGHRPEVGPSALPATQNAEDPHQPHPDHATQEAQEPAVPHVAGAINAALSVASRQATNPNRGGGIHSKKRYRT